MKILLVDLSAIFWRNWHASKDQAIGDAFALTVNRINSVRHSYDHVAVCCDCQPYKRKEISANYKAQRDAPDPAAVGQLRRVKERLAADGLLLWESLGYEADDIIATAVRALTEGIGDESYLAIYILTADKDLMALVSDRVTLVHLSDGTRFDPEMVRAKLGVEPYRVSELLALTGDKSDNVPGCPGIGPKKAAQLLADNGLLENILHSSVSMDVATELIRAPVSVKESLVAHRDNIQLSWQLVQLMTDAPIDINELFATRDQKQIGEPMTEEQLSHTEPDDPTEPSQAIELSKPSELLKLDPVAFEKSLEPRNAVQAWTLARGIFASRLFAVESAEAALMILMTGREMGIGAMSAMRGFHFIKGKPVMSAQLMAALILRSGKAEYWELIDSTSKSATYATKRIGGRNEQKKTFSVDDARLAQLVKQDSTWMKYPASMCEARASAMLARIVYPDLLMGVYLPDEMDDA